MLYNRINGWSSNVKAITPELREANAFHVNAFFQKHLKGFPAAFSLYNSMN